jgi:hypothetical protein
VGFKGDAPKNLETVAWLHALMMARMMEEEQREGSPEYAAQVFQDQGLDMLLPNHRPEEVLLSPDLLHQLILIPGDMGTGTKHQEWISEARQWTNRGTIREPNSNDPTDMNLPEYLINNFGDDPET